MTKNDEYIKRVVKGKTFVDVGPLWGLVNEKVSVANYYGAKAVTAIDQWPTTDGLWEAFHKRMQSLKVNYNWFPINVFNWQGPPFDVTYCVGVLYHHPDPPVLLQKLYSMTNEYLILGSTVTRQKFRNTHGGSVSLSTINESEREMLLDEWISFLEDRYVPGLTTTDPVIWDAGNMYLWWWMLTQEYINSMCQDVGFQIEEQATLGDHLTLMLLKKL